MIKRDRKKRFLFSSLQSNYASQNLPSEFIEQGNLQSIILKSGDRIKTKSSAALTVARQLSGFWPALYMFMIIPKFFRDWVYNIIAKNRYKWFGKREMCMIPSPELKHKFID